MDTLTREALEHHHVWVSGDRAWQRPLRLLQALWREEQGLAMGHHPRESDDSRPLGSRLALPDAEQHLSNYLTGTIRDIVRTELTSPAAQDEHKLFSAPRIYDDLLSSQPLCFNLFGELKADLDVATAVFRHLWPNRVETVTRLEFEHSPGRGDERYLGNRTAFDVYLEHTVVGGGNGFIAIEVKYHEDLQVEARDTRERVHDVARGSETFDEASLPQLGRPPLQQVWFDHLLALSMLQADASHWQGNGLFVFLHPVANVACYEVVNAYERHLRRPGTFQRMSLEELIAALELADGRPWVRMVRERYLDYNRVNRA